ncbi:MAG: hypothetical protein Q8N39_08705 [Pelolinea sp.]|nr:hypothetical protein [Pelolinea sp.]
MKRQLSLIFLFLMASLLVGFSSVLAQEVTPPVIVDIFFSAGCGDCWPYAEDVLLPALKSSGISATSEIHDYTIPEERQRMSEMIDAIELPRSIADSLYAFIPTGKGTLVVLGYVPANLITAALNSPSLPQKLVLWQPKVKPTKLLPANYQSATELYKATLPGFSKKCKLPAEQML